MVIILKHWLKNLINSTKALGASGSQSFASITLDRAILLAIFTLVGVGLLQVYTSSFIFATETYGDGLFFFRKQLLFSLIGAVVLLITAYFPWKWVESYGWALWCLAAAGVALSLIPSLGVKAGGASRWLRIPFVGNFEPSELLKVSLPFLMATLLVDDLRRYGKYRWLIRVLAILVPFLLLIKQPDFGSIVISTAVILSILFVFGLRWQYIIGGMVTGSLAFYVLVVNSPYRLARVKAVLDPWSDAAGKGFQVIQSMLSFHSGGLTGVGIGQGQGKLFFLPEAHTDFTLAVMGEELGFVGVFTLLMIFGFLVLRGFQIAVRTEDLYKKIVAMGLTVLFALQVFTNMGVTMGLLPTKGLTLPFMSYGGSSLLMMMFLFGILLNIERQRTEK